jgi:hypothetical protein
VVVSIELLNKKGIDWCKRDIAQKMEAAQQSSHKLLRITKKSCSTARLHQIPTTHI